MVCASCGIKNVEFASSCFACGSALSGRAEPRAAAASSRAPRSGSLPSPVQSVAGVVKLVRGVVRLAVAAAIFFAVVGRLPDIRAAVESMLQSAREPSTPPATESAEPAPGSSVVEEQAPAVLDEQNGFQLTHFSLALPEGRDGGHFRLGETVRGRSEIKGFEISPSGDLDVTITFAFRDPNGNLVEPISPSVLKQKAESDTLYTDFYYDVAADATEGHYDLELGVDDAVSGRSVRFHRTIPIDPAGEPS